MKKHVIMLTTSALILVCGAIVASAQQTPGTEGPGAEQGPATQQGPTLQQQQPGQQGAPQERKPQQGPADPLVQQQQGQQGTVEERMQRRFRGAHRDDDEDHYADEYRYGDEYRRFGRRMMGPYGHGSDEEDCDRDDYRSYRGRMMGPYGHGMMGSNDRWRSRRGEPQQGAGLAGPMGSALFALMDSDGDGKISLQEWQAAHERIFRAMDTDKDGTVSLDEMQQFMRASRPPASRP